ncbi:MAG: hypothetical protein WBN41_00790 [Lysobacterales bacterium]
MNTIHNNGENDKSLNDGIEKLGRAYDQLPNEEPPELLDQAILSSAHRAVEKKPHWMKFGWLHGLTTAAVVVLALSIIINQREQVPGFDDAIRVEVPAGPVREKAGKKRTGVDQVKDLSMELKEEDPGRQLIAPNAPVATAADNEALEVSAGDQPPEYESRVRRSMTAQDSAPAKTDRVDADKVISDMPLEEPMMDEAVLPGDAAEYQIMSKQPQPATIGAVQPEGAVLPVHTDAEIEEQLLSIIKLKQSGDKAWISKLEEFRQTYPDYPLPEALSD